MREVFERILEVGILSGFFYWANQEGKAQGKKEEKDRLQQDKIDQLEKELADLKRRFS